MTPYKQLIVHNEANRIWGDCYRTAIGCLLDTPPEKVPHWWEGCWDDTDEDAIHRVAAMQQWLGGRGYRLISIPLRGEDVSVADVISTISSHNPGVYYILSGESSPGVNHAVICIDHRIEHDPSHSNRGLSGPLVETQEYCVEMLIPVDQTIYREFFRSKR